MQKSKIMKNLFLITMLFTFSSCMVSTKVFDTKMDEMQKQIDSKLPRFEFEMKDQSTRQAINDLRKDCCKVKNDTINGKCKM